MLKLSFNFFFALSEGQTCNKAGVGKKLGCKKIGDTLYVIYLQGLASLQNSWRNCIVSLRRKVRRKIEKGLGGCGYRVPFAKMVLSPNPQTPL